MKNEKKSVEDFPHQLSFQLTAEDYLEYSRLNAIPQWDINKRKAKFYAILMGLLGIGAMVRGYFSDGRWGQLYTVGGILLITYQIFNLIYTYKVFPNALDKTIRKEVAQDARLTQRMTLCFAPDKIISFSQREHQATFFLEDFKKQQTTANNLILVLRNGKNVVIPKRELEKADAEVKAILDKIGNTKTAAQ